MAKHAGGKKLSRKKRLAKRNRALKQEYGGLPDASRGTAAWAMQQLRKDALVAFMEDLLECEGCGLTQEQCDVARKALAKLVLAASAIPDRFPRRRSILGDLEKFVSAYEEWNGPPGEGSAQVAARRKALRKMYRARHKLAEVMRKNSYILANELDLELAKDLYEAMGGIAKALPDVFVSLAKAFERFSRRVQ